MAQLEARQPQVVVVDDEKPIVDFICEALEDTGVPALGCVQAAEAFWCIRQYHPRLVILDVQMPGVDGITLLHQLRADPHTAELPVIFLTANSHRVEQQMPDYQALGATLVPKPFDLDHLLTLVNAALDR